MIKVDLFIANKNLSLRKKNATFLEGEVYMGRMSKDGEYYVLKSEEGYWIPVISYHWARSMESVFKENFSNLKQPVYFSNYKELREIGWMYI